MVVLVQLNSYGKIHRTVLDRTVHTLYCILVCHIICLSLQFAKVEGEVLSIFKYFLKTNRIYRTVQYEF